MIIDSTYFIGKETYIPNAVLQPSIGSNNISATSELLQEIEDKESELMLDVLGLAKLLNYITNLSQTVAGKLPLWLNGVDLVDGKDNWKGLRYTIGGKKVSLIAYYVFFYYLANDYHTYTTTGMQIAKSENAVTQDPSIKQVSIWNKFIKMYVGSLMINQVQFTSNWNGTAMSFNGINLSNEVSLYEFLLNNKDVYDISYFKSKSVINYFGL